MSHRLRVAIIDDEPLAVRRLQIALGEMSDVEIAGVASDGAAALGLIETIRPDLIFLDVKMPVMNGLEVLAALPPESRPAVILVTAFSRFAVSAFEAAAIDYLLKPVEFPRLREAVDRVRASQRARQADTRIAELLALVADLQAADADLGAAPRREADLWIAEKNGAARVPLRDIEMIAAEGDYVRIHTTARSYLLKQRIRVLADRLGEGDFMRVHRSALVRISAIGKLTNRPAGGLQLALRSGRIVPVGRSFEAAIRQLKRSPPA
jgi:DNA-binding LytR/AlgR family response regulator